MTTSKVQKASRIAAVGAAATAGVLSTLVFNPSALSLVADQTPLAQSAATTGSMTTAGTGSSGSSGSGTSATSAGTGAVSSETTSASQTYTGDAVQTRYGPVQVEVTVDGSGTVTDITWLDYPANEGKSVQINQRAMPLLTDEALQAQSADVSTIAGASYTSQGFTQSLQSALDQAGV